MKRKTMTACVLAMTLTALAGCSNNNSTPATTAATQTSTTVESETVSSETAETSLEAKTVSPLPSGIDMDNLNDCTVAVSFDKGDAFVDDTGAMQLKVKVYTYDSYDLVDISTLQVGDTITINQQDVKVTTLDRDEDGTVIINGGIENGGYELVSSDETTFYANGYDDLKQYYEIGETTIPVSADLEFEDASDPDKDPTTYYAGDFLTDDSGIEYNFVPTNTTITIQDGSVVRMERIYNP